MKPTYLEPSRIIYMEAAVNYTRFHLVDGQRLLTTKTLKCYEAYYKTKGFMRIHRSSMVNPSYIENYCKYTQTVFLSTGQELRVSRGRRGVVETGKK